VSADKIIVSGFLIRCPLGGYAWQILHYMVGLRQLGFDPYFVEDTSSFPGCYDPRTNSDTDDPTSGIAFAEGFFAHYGFADRWTFRDIARDRTVGLGGDARNAVLAEARVAISLAGVNRLPSQPGQQRVFIDFDPAYTQIRAASGDRALLELLNEHDALFTLGENIGRPGCRVPTAGFTWHPTRQPIALDLWPSLAADARAAFTTVGRWDENRREIHFEGETYSWRKRVEWMKFLALPQRTGARFRVAMDVAKLPDDLRVLQENGWEVTDPIALSADAERYHDFICASRGEFTVAKDLNVRLATGWFSDRSACYLAAGRPVITQDTGFDRIFPTGKGLFSVRSIDEAADAVRASDADSAQHSHAARDIAERFFGAEHVLRELLSVL
jgi:hypothetical protein